MVGKVSVPHLEVDFVHLGTFNLDQTHLNSFRLIQAHASSFELIQAYFTSYQLIQHQQKSFQIEHHSEDAYLCKESELRLIKLKVLRAKLGFHPIPKIKSEKMTTVIHCQLVMPNLINVKIHYDAHVIKKNPQRNSQYLLRYLETQRGYQSNNREVSVF